jgi:hypothetical protein
MWLVQHFVEKELLMPDASIVNKTLNSYQKFLRPGGMAEIASKLISV